MFVPVHNRSWEPEAVTLFAATGTLSDTRKRQCNTLIRQLKEAGIWTKLDALYVLANSTSTAALINWKNPGTYNLTAVNSPTFTTDVGFSANGTATTVYLDTNINRQGLTQYKQNSASIFAWCLEGNAGVGASAFPEAMGLTGATDWVLLGLGNDAGQAPYFYFNDGTGTNLSSTPNDISGFWSGSRTASNAVSIYKNGSAQTTGASATSVAYTNTGNIKIGVGTDGGYNGGVACAGFGSQMDATAHSALYTALNQYMQAVCQTTYTGPQDIVASATAWYGLRAIDRAHIGANCVDIIRASDSATQTFLTTPGGGVDVAGITTFLTSTTGKVTKIWDQTGNGSHCIQATDANRPSITLNSLHGFPTLTASGTTMTLACAAASFNGGSQLPIPWTQSGVGYNSQSAGTYGTLIADQGDIGMFFLGTNQVSFYATGDHLFTASANAWHAVGWTSNSTSSLGIVDTTPTGTFTNANTANFNSRSEIEIVSDGGDPMTGGWMEVGVWPVAFSTTDHSNMSANQRTFWGF